MAQNTYSIKQFLKLEPTTGTPPSEDGIIWYDSGAAKFKKIENGSTTDLSGGTISSGVAGRLGLYPTTGSSIDDVYIQNSQNIDVNIVAQPTRSAAIEYTIPNPGDAVTAASFVLTEGAQTINGNKTFGNNVIVTGDLTVNGTTTSLNTTNTDVKDKLVTLNKGGAAASAGGSGLEFEENASITGYIKTSAARTGFDLKAPATAGVATVVTDASSWTYTLPAHSGTVMTDVVDDTTPQLGGELDVNGNAIASASNGNIAIAPHGTGRVRLAKQGALTRYVDLTYVDAVTLTASTTAVVSSLTFDSTTIKAQEVKYTIVEATTFKRSIGTLMVVGDGNSGVASSVVSIVDTGTSTADPGVTFSAALNGNNIEISATTTANTKTAQFVVQRFLA